MSTQTFDEWPVFLTTQDLANMLQLPSVLTVYEWNKKGDRSAVLPRRQAAPVPEERSPEVAGRTRRVPRLVDQLLAERTSAALTHLCRPLDRVPGPSTAVVLLPTSRACLQRTMWLTPPRSADSLRGDLLPRSRLPACLIGTCVPIAGEESHAPGTSRTSLTSILPTRSTAFPRTLR
jgi:hypothetical protein